MSVSTAPPADDVSNISCQGCGLYDASLRYSVHPQVISLIATQIESAAVGIWCARCRGIHAAKAVLVSLLLGWWSLRGPKLTIDAIRMNFKGPDLHVARNARLLRAIGRHEYDNENPDFAVLFVAAAHSVQPQKENSSLLGELTRAGYRAKAQQSPWRFAVYAPIVLVTLLLGGLAVRLTTAMASGTPKKPDVIAPVKRATLVADPPSSPETPGSDRALAATYFRTRLRELRNDVPMMIRRGDSLMSIKVTLQSVASKPAVAAMLETQPMKTSFENLNASLDDAMSYYHGGAPVETIERTAGESMKVTEGIELQAIAAAWRGHGERASRLASEADRREDSIEEMRYDLAMRGAVIGILQQAFDRCLGTAR